MSERTTIDKAAWLHVYGQHFYHGPAMLRGNRAALEALRAAVDQALEAGTGEAEVFASDGEGYHVQVHRVNTMATLGTPEYLYELEFKMGAAAAERERKLKFRL